MLLYGENIAHEVDPFGEEKNFSSFGFVDYFPSEKDGKITQDIKILY